MSPPCSDSFRAMAEVLGGIACETAHPFVTFRAPGSLRHPSMLVVEAVMIGGALLALAHAIRTRRVNGNPAPLALWCAAVVFVAALEPPLYFTHELGFGEHLDVVFAHNVFSVQLLYDRLPLYIVMLYPSGIYLSYVLVDRLGVFERFGRLTAAVTVGFVHQCFYEIFDHIGPQFFWWTWNPSVPSNSPTLGSVPLTSMVTFAILAPAMLTLAWRWLIAEPLARGGLGAGAVALRTIAAGLASPVLLVLSSAPLSAVQRMLPSHSVGVFVLYYGAIVVAGIVAIRALAGGRPVTPPEDRILAGYPLWHGIAYLAIFTALWLAAVPGYIAASHGEAPGGGPVGSLGYAVACATVGAWVLWRASARSAIAPDIAVAH